MDPNATLAEMRAEIRKLFLDEVAGRDYNKDRVHALLGMIDDLDEWLSRGGFLPQAWA